jgi:hypothetical protein
MLKIEKGDMPFSLYIQYVKINISSPISNHFFNRNMNVFKSIFGDNES